MTQPRDFAPISRDRSMRVRVAAAWLLWNGILGIALSGFVVAGALLGDPEMLPTRNIPELVLLVAWSVGLVWSGRQLSQRKRRGGTAGIVCNGLSLLSLVLRRDFFYLHLLIPIAGIVAIVSVWEELSE